MARRDSILHKPKDTRGALRRMLAFLGPFKWLILLVALLCVASNLLALWGPDLAGHAINEAAACTSPGPEAPGKPAHGLVFSVGRAGRPRAGGP